jgi:hypothetical protein
MVVQVISSSLMASDLTQHQARCVGSGWWEASWLRGRKLTADQAVAAMLVAEEAQPVMADVREAVGPFVGSLGLTPLEAIGMATAVECDWPRPPVAGGLRRMESRLRWWRHVG